MIAAWGAWVTAFALLSLLSAVIGLLACEMSRATPHRTTTQAELEALLRRRLLPAPR